MFLDELGYLDLDMLHQAAGIQNIHDSETNVDIRGLGFIAICLTTGSLGDAVRALRLTLMKNGKSTLEDIDSTKELFSALREATDWLDIFPFVVSRSKVNIDK
jgi:histone acetyltransferase (RNA polymerase elongator complex component)